MNEYDYFVVISCPEQRFNPILLPIQAPRLYLLTRVLFVTDLDFSTVVVDVAFDS